jgi:nitrate/nitrite-specific signal transduction histidine kinase
VCRHAQAEHAWIQLTALGAGVELTVRDDGRGFAVPGALTTLLRTGHLGLASMREQVAQLGGHMIITSQPGEGTEIIVRVGIPDDSSDVAVGVAASSSAPATASSEATVSASPMEAA